MKAVRWMVAVAAVMALCGLALAQGNYDNDNRARQHGYRHGYVDGYHHGQEDRGEGESYEMRSEDYARADHGYDSAMGDKDDFQHAYRKGYKDGYDDGYNSRNPRFGQDEDYGGYWNRGDNQGRDYNDNNPGNSGWGYGGGNNRVPGIPRNPQWTAMDPRSIGFRIGFEIGLEDWMAQRSYTPTEGHFYQDADAWYDQATTHQDFKRAFRRGYMEGYQESYNNQRWHRVGGDGSFGDGFRSGLRWGLADTNRGKPYNPARLPDYRSHSGDTQYQDGFMQGYEWAFQARQLR